MGPTPKDLSEQREAENTAPDPVPSIVQLQLPQACDLPSFYDFVFGRLSYFEHYAPDGGLRVAWGREQKRPQQQSAG